ncbi:MAG: glycosyltransferase family 4 protein [Cyclobacteriaceae bacterium]
MKIAIIINTSWNIYNFRKGLIDHFMAQGHQIIAIAPRDDYSQKLVDLGCSYYALDFPGTSTNPVTDLSLIWRLYGILKTSKPDIILTYTIKPNIYTSLVSAVLKIPCICNVSGLGTVFLWKGSLKKIAVTLYRLAFRFSSWIFFQNEEDRKDFVEVVPINLKKTSVLPGSGVNLQHFQLYPFNPDKTTTFLMIGRLIIEKGVIEFSEAAKHMCSRHSNVKFRIIGGYEPGHARSIDRALIDEWKSGSCIEWLDHQNDIRKYIEAADVVVLPSYREGTPKTLLEAGAMGKALIATDVPGCRQVVKDGVNGFLCKVKDSKDLANKMRLYLSLNREEKLQMHTDSRKHIEENYDENIVIGLYEQKIKELSGEKS